MPTKSTKTRFSRRQKRIPCALLFSATVGRMPIIVPCALRLLSGGYPKKGAVQNSGPDEPIIGEVTLGGRIPLPRFGGVPPARDATGDIDSMDFLAGQCSGLVRQIEPAAVVVHEIVEEAARILTERARQVGTASRSLV